MNMYSLETGAWSHHENGWDNELQVVDRDAVFLNGKLHLLTYDLRILSVDTGEDMEDHSFAGNYAC